MRGKRRKGRWILRLSRLLILGVAMLVLLGSFVLRIDALVGTAGMRDIVSGPYAASADCILVLGAQVRSDGSVSLMLADRLDTALELYEAGVSDRILVSGDHARDDYDEVNAMRDYLMARGVPSSRIFMDHAGFDTYDSLYRARDVFEVRSCVVVTQEFHLKRALYIAGELGLEAQGVDAALHEYGRADYYRAREILARTKAYLDCVVLHSKPTYLGPVIPIGGDGNATVD